MNAVAATITAIRQSNLPRRNDKRTANHAPDAALHRYSHRLWRGSSANRFWTWESVLCRLRDLRMPISLPAISSNARRMMFSFGRDCCHRPERPTRFCHSLSGAAAQRADMCQKALRKYRSGLSQCLEVRVRSSPRAGDSHNAVGARGQFYRRTLSKPPPPCPETHRWSDNSGEFQMNAFCSHSSLPSRPLANPGPI